MIEKLIGFIEIVILFFYGIYKYLQYYVLRMVYKKSSTEKTTKKLQNVKETFENGNDYELQEEETDENIESQSDFNIYRPNELYSYNINDYNDYSISKNQPENLVLPKNYAFQTQKFESELPDYDYRDFNNIDGAGVHLYSTWKTNPVNMPWFETCLSPMNCKVVEGNLEKFNYNN